jgi:hypothetical protein
MRTSSLIRIYRYMGGVQKSRFEMSLVLKKNQLLHDNSKHIS